MTNFNDFLNEQMKDPEFKAEWDALDPEFSVIEAMLKARKESGLTQKQLSERTGIAQTDISKLERGNANPSLRTLQRLAAGMGMKVAPDSEVCLDGKLIKKEEKKTRITCTFFSLHQTDRTVWHFSKISLHKSRPHQHMRKPNLKWESPVKT